LVKKDILIFSDEKKIFLIKKVEKLTKTVKKQKKGLNPL